MSHTIRLKNPENGETMMVPSDVRFPYNSPAEDAETNITYNYTPLFRRVIDEDVGIEKIYGMTGQESINILLSGINSLKDTDRDIKTATIKKEIKELKSIIDKSIIAVSDNTVLTENNAKVSNAVLDIAASRLRDMEARLNNSKGKKVQGNTWDCTEYNARYALIRLLVLALQCPSGIWDGD